MRLLTSPLGPRGKSLVLATTLVLKFWEYMETFLQLLPNVMRPLIIYDMLPMSLSPLVPGAEHPGKGFLACSLVWRQGFPTGYITLSGPCHILSLPVLMCVAGGSLATQVQSGRALKPTVPSGPLSVSLSSSAWCRDFIWGFWR